MGSRPIRVAVVTALLLVGTLAESPAAATTGPLVLTQSRTLTADYEGEIVIAADGIVLDGAGYTVDGGGGLCIGVDAAGRTGVTIKNVRITNFYCAGIRTGGTDNHLIGNVAEANGAGIVVEAGSNTLLIGNRADDNLNNGFQIHLGSNHNTFRDNSADGNQGTAGFAMAESDWNTFSGNTVTNSALDGFNVLYGAHNTFSGNTVTGCGSVGFAMHFDTDSVVRDNLVAANALGIAVASTSHGNKIRAENHFGTTNGL